MPKKDVWAAFTPAELRVMRRLSTPQKIQTFLDAMSYNTEIPRETCRSPREVLVHRKAHCIEGALFAAACLRLAGHKPLILDLEADGDHDHVVCLFIHDGYWGAISKSRFHSLGYRDPIFASVRELALTYFPAYHNYRGQKTLRRYSVPIDLTRFDRNDWMTSTKDLWVIGNHLFTVKHFSLVPTTMEKKLRLVPSAAQYADTARPPKGWKNGKPKKGH